MHIGDFLDCMANRSRGLALAHPVDRTPGQAMSDIR